MMESSSVLREWPTTGGGNEEGREREDPGGCLPIIPRVEPTPSRIAAHTIFWDGTLSIGLAHWAVGIFLQSYTGSSNCVIGNSLEPRELANLNGMDAQASPDHEPREPACGFFLVFSSIFPL